MAKIIRTTQNLPKLFDINKYKNTDRLNPFEWLLLLRHRIFIYENACISCGDFDYSEEELDFFGECDPSEEIEKLLANPLDLFDSYYTLKSVKDWNTDDLDQNINQAIYNMTVKDLTVSDYQELELLHDCTKIYLNIDDNESISYPAAVNFMQYCTEARRQYGIFKDMPWADEESSIYHKTLTGGYYPTLINPYSNDEQLVNDLLGYVQKLREKLNINPNEFITVDFQNLQKWASYQILPIMDLLIWSKTQQAKITNSVLCVVAFPTGLYGESNLAKSIFPIINDFFNIELFSKQINGLSKFVASEIWKDSDKYFPENKWSKTDWNRFTKEFIEHWLPIKHSK
ncbi:DUF6387 family protein [Acinetobacter sp. YH12073]|mgnify:CR=1 FL=1|uniref:DUF6387 family protein n=1 Tax=Acinetobacter sp. YH12073 TaxID=2601069 RepID=UPI0015D16E62|nr:DUF6387 family protein [Acinetobacter sp. YH12073]